MKLLKKENTRYEQGAKKENIFISKFVLNSKQLLWRIKWMKKSIILLLARVFHISII